MSIKSSNLDMQVEKRNFFKKFDGNLALVIFALNLIGLINLYSATHGVVLDHTAKLFYQQIFWLLGGWVLYFLVTLVDYKFFYRLAYFFYGLNLVALALVPFIGKTYYGAQRWLDLGFFRYQPSETMKIIMIFVIARILSQKSSYNGLGFKDLLLPGVLTLIPFALTVKQPDLGTALLIASTTLSLLIFVRLKRSILVTACLIGIITLPAVWSFGLKDYQKGRILTFLNPGRDPHGAGYNSIQSKIAVGSGQVLGKGFRKGTQSQLEFLPERHTDFIYSVLSEEHGFIGSITTFGLFVVLFFMCIRVATQARDKFGALIVVGIVSYLFWHMFINIGMVIGVMPIVGVPLPLLSYGGSSMLTTMLGLGVISSVAYRKYLF
ncbi:MAG: rod shape-determining protein RodA [Bdellovibrionales bacterium]|nr:rod shape-determining protein RodA [Bdellovibrionales bacterium]